MKETVNVSIASQAFVLDRDAYHLLSVYLREIKIRLGGTESDETYADVEARIAEIFREKLPSPMLVVTIGIAREAMAQMGTPDDFGVAGSAGASGATSGSWDYRTARRNFDLLRRSSSDRVIAGVCGGVAEHFGIDAAMLRLVTVLLILFGGLSLWVYIILWLIIPSNQ